MKKVYLIIGLFVLAKYSFATDYLASTVQEAIILLNKAKAGDRISLKNGTYNNQLIKFQNNNGSEEQQVTFTAETPGKVFFEGNSSLSFSGKFIAVSGFTWRNGGQALGNKSVIELKASNSTFSQCAIIDYNSADTVDNKWVSVYGEYNTITHCLFRDKRNLGATLTVWLTPGKQARHTISYNYFYGRHNGPGADNGLESIRIGDSKTSFENAHCVVALNRFENCDGEIEIISNKSCHNSYLHNTFYGSDGGLTLRHGNECLVDGNVFDGAGKPLAYGVRFIGEGHAAINNYFFNLHAAAKEIFRAPLTLVTGLVNTPINGYFQVRRALISDNIFVNCSTPDIRIGATPKREGATLAPDTVTITNNLIYAENGEAGHVYEEILKPTHIKISNNLIVGKGLVSNVRGFIRDAHGKLIASMSDKVSLPHDCKAGADWVEPSLLKAIAGKKYTIVSVEKVGTGWVSR